jgi:hypothetical protein
MIVNKDDLANSIGWGVIVIGIIASFLAGNAFRVVSYSSSTYAKGPFNFSIAISGIIVSILFGLIFILIGEILRAVYDNRDKIALLSDQMKTHNKDII